MFECGFSLVNCGGSAEFRRFEDVIGPVWALEAFRDILLFRVSLLIRCYPKVLKYRHPRAYNILQHKGISLNSSCHSERSLERKEPPLLTLLLNVQTRLHMVAASALAISCPTVTQTRPALVKAAGLNTPPKSVKAYDSDAAATRPQHRTLEEL